MSHEQEETIINQAPVETDPADEVGLPDEVELTDKVDLATKEIRIRADMSGGKGSSSRIIEFNVSPTVFDRAKQLLEKKGIKPIQIGEAVVFAVAITAVGAVVTKKITERRQEKKRLEKETQIPHLTEEQEENFIAMYDSYYARVLGYIYQRVGHAQHAEDLTHDVFTKALIAFPRFVPDPDHANPHLAWLLTIAHNEVARDYIKKKRREKKIKSVEYMDVVGTKDSPTALFSRKRNVEDELEQLLGEPSEEREIFRQALESLSDIYKSVIWLRIVEDLSIEEVADILGKSKGATKSLLHRAKEALERQIFRILLDISAQL